MKEDLPKEHLMIQINVLNDPEKRELILEAYGEQYQNIVRRLEDE